MLKRRFLALWLVVAFMFLGTGVVSGQNYPTRPVRILASGPGNALDYVARLVGQEIAGPLGQPVIIENRPTTVLSDMAARATPDGYTIFFGAGATWLTPLLKVSTYDAVKDFSPITTVVYFPYVLIVHPALPVASVKELIALAKAKPGVLNYASQPDPGAASWLGGELFKAMTGANIVRVAYKDAALGLIAVLANESQLMFVAPGPAISSAKTGKVKALAVTSLQPSQLVPGVPTLAAAAGLPGFEVSSTIGALAPAGTPEAIVNRLNQEIVRVLGRADVKEKLLTNGSESLGSSPQEFAALIKADIARWGKIYRDAGLKPE